MNVPPRPCPRRGATLPRFHKYRLRAVGKCPKGQSVFAAGIWLPASFSKPGRLDMVRKQTNSETKSPSDARIANSGLFVSDHPFPDRHRRHPAGHGLFRLPAEAVCRQRARPRGTRADRKHQGNRARHRCPIPCRGGCDPGAARFRSARNQQHPRIRKAAAPHGRRNRAGFRAGGPRRTPAHQHPAAGRPAARHKRSRPLGAGVCRAADRHFQHHRRQDQRTAVSPPSPCR